MSQNQLNFPIDIKKSTKHLVYADIKKSRTYHESNDDIQEKVKDSPYHWTVESVKFRASEVDYFKFE